VKRHAPYQNALVTGASAGLGRGLSLALAARGAHVVVAARRRAELDAVVETITARGGSAEALVLDCGDADAVHAEVSALDARLPLDLVVANAGLGGATPGRDLRWSDTRDILQLNVLGTAATLSAAVPGMVARRRGHLAAVASLAGLRGLPGSAAYSASKAAIRTFAESLRIDLRDVGITVTAVSPGYVRTAMTASHQGPMPFLMDLDPAVRIILRSLEERRDTCEFPWSMAALARLGALLPASMFEWLARHARFPT
jgi:short-subunit dehydrogenase